jgi:hypothetical protein
MKPKSLFSNRVIETALQGSAATIPPEHLAIIQNWQAKTEFKSSETNLDGSFITGFLCPLLGYEEANKTGAWTIQKNTAIPGGGNVDVGIGHFDQAGKAQIVAPFELKGPKTKDLDALMAGRAKSPVQQAWEYATFIKGAQWVLVSNMVETRLYAVEFYLESGIVCRGNLHPVGLAKNVRLISFSLTLCGTIKRTRPRPTPSLISHIVRN